MPLLNSTPTVFTQSCKPAIVYPIVSKNYASVTSILSVNKIFRSKFLNGMIGSCHGIVCKRWNSARFESLKVFPFRFAVDWCHRATSSSRWKRSLRHRFNFVTGQLWLNWGNVIQLLIPADTIQFVMNEPNLLPLCILVKHIAFGFLLGKKNTLDIQMSKMIILLSSTRLISLT